MKVHPALIGLISSGLMIVALLAGYYQLISDGATAQLVAYGCYAAGLVATLLLHKIDASSVARLTGLDMEDDKGYVYPLSEDQLSRLVPFVGTTVDTTMFDYYLTTRSRCH